MLGVPYRRALADPAARSTHWQSIKSDLVEEIDRDYGVFEGTTFQGGTLRGLAG